MPAERFLILAGTADARELANALHGHGMNIVSSFAGVTKVPLYPAGDIRVGGFGGTEGLIAYLQNAGITRIVDATHPFAAQMSAHAVEAAAHVGLPLSRLERPAWVAPADQNWISVESMADAAHVVPTGSRVLLTTGHKGLSAFLSRLDLRGVVRTIETPAEPLPPRWQLLQDRPPFTCEGETQVLQDHRITLLVSKNSGGTSTASKLVAAALRRVQVVMVERPKKPECATVQTVAQALALLGIKADNG